MHLDVIYLAHSLCWTHNWKLALVNSSAQAVASDMPTDFMQLPLRLNLDVMHKWPDVYGLSTDSQKSDISISAVPLALQ